MLINSSFLDSVWSFVLLGFFTLKFSLKKIFFYLSLAELREKTLFLHFSEAYSWGKCVCVCVLGEAWLIAKMTGQMGGIGMGNLVGKEVGTTVDTGFHYLHTRAYYVTEHKSVGCQAFGEFKTLFELEMCLSAWCRPLSRGISRAACGLPPLLILTVASMQSCTWGVLLGFDGHDQGSEQL